MYYYLSAFSRPWPLFLRGSLVEHRAIYRLVSFAGCNLYRGLICSPRRHVGALNAMTITLRPGGPPADSFRMHLSPVGLWLFLVDAGRLFFGLVWGQIPPPAESLMLSEPLTGFAAAASAVVMSTWPCCCRCLYIFHCLYSPPLCH